MSYIQNFEHFINYINLMAQEDALDIDFSKIDKDNSLKELKVIYDSGFADKFIQLLKKEKEILYGDNLYSFLENIENSGKKSLFFSYEYYNEKFSKDGKDKKFRVSEALEELGNQLNGKKGIYVISTKTSVLYVGKSQTNLGNRFFKSFTEKSKEVKRKQQIYIQYIVITTSIDCSLTELIYINKLRPLLNKADNSGTPPELIISNLQELSKKIKCFKHRK